MVVKHFIDQNRTDGESAYNIRSTYPSRIIPTTDYTMSLRELDMVPSATLILQSKDIGNNKNSNINESNTSGGLFDSVYNGVVNIFRSLGFS